MPGLEEVERYLTGLWQLLRGERDGLRLLDLTDRGALRSFWAILYCFPPMLLSWIWWRGSFLASMPTGTRAGGMFFFRVALVEAASWIVPLVLVGLIAWTLGIGARYAGIVTATNWLSVPLSYAFGGLVLVLMLIPPLAGVVAFLWFLLMLTMIFAYYRVLMAICDDHVLTAVTLTMVLLVPAVIFSDTLERFLGILPG